MRVYVFLLLATSAASAQTISSTIKGTVQDPSGAMVPDAACTLTNSSTAATSTVTSAHDGSFQFLDVLAGTYVLTVHAPGFKAYRLNDLTVVSSEFHTVGSVVLEVGRASESVEVAEKAPPVQLSSGERSDLVSGAELNDIAVKGRDFVSYLSTLTGIVDTNSTSRDAFQRNAMSGIHINGGRDSQTLMVLDGMPIIDAGNNGTSQEPNMDSIAEVRVLTSNYQAEYGRNGGGTVTVISKSGSRSFHGSAYDYYRNEELNANNFFNNATNTPRPPYRYRMTGYSIGGPVLIPWNKNALKDKLFFFFSQELVGSQVSYAPKFVTTPSALERQGDFSQSYNVNGALISIRDPLTGKAFPGNVIPASRFDSIGAAILNFYPLPNYVDPNPTNRYRYNYRSLYSGSWPRRQELGKIDANFWPSFQVFYRVVDDYSALNSPWGNWVDGSVNYALTPIVWDRPARAHTVHATKTFSPTLVNEVLIGKSFNGVYINPLDPSAVERSRIGNPPQLFPDSAGSPDFLPGITFGGTPSNTINSTLDGQLPEGILDDAFVFSDNLSKVWRSHQLKIGFYAERNRKVQDASVNFRGTYNFATNGNNPNNSGDGFSNALLGNFDTYTEANNSPVGDYLFWNAEWYAQDNWRVSRRLTLDFGLRFYHIPSTVDLNHSVATFDPNYYTAANAPVLYRPGKDASGQRLAQDPLTGAFAPAVFIGQFVPGAGSPADGAKIGGIGGYPGGLYNSPWLGFGPRFGFAYDLFGNGKTALRGGFGMFKDRVQGNLIYSSSGNPPVTSTPTISYGNFNTIAQGSGLMNPAGANTQYGPSAISEVFGTNPLPNVMNFSLGIQHQLNSTMFDVAYVGSLSRHLPLGININPIPMFARFQPGNFDPTQAPNTPLPDNFLRPYGGYANITSYQFMGTANYNSLQVSARRRLSRGLQFGAAYTFSKALGEASSDTEAVSPYFSPRQRNYGPLNFDRRQSASVNYLYELPRAGSRLGWRPAKWVLDDWQLSGITTFQTGSPFTPGFSTTNGQDISGSTEAARIDVVGNPYQNLTPGTYFNVAAFARPAKGTFGNAGTNILTGPGINNWDISIGKRFVFSERRLLQFRTELFNAWNHTQFSGLYTSASYQPSGGQIDPNIGLPSSARPPRNIQLSLRLTF